MIIYWVYVQDDIGLSGLTHPLRHHTWVSRAFVISQTFQSLGETSRTHGQQEQLQTAGG